MKTLVKLLKSLVAPLLTLAIGYLAYLTYNQTLLTWNRFLDQKVYEHLKKTSETSVTFKKGEGKAKLSTANLDVAAQLLYEAQYEGAVCKDKLQRISEYLKTP